MQKQILNSNEFWVNSLNVFLFCDLNKKVLNLWKKTIQEGKLIIMSKAYRIIILTMYIYFFFK